MRFRNAVAVPLLAPIDPLLPRSVCRAVLEDQRIGGSFGIPIVHVLSGVAAEVVGRSALGDSLFKRLRQSVRFRRSSAAALRSVRIFDAARRHGNPVGRRTVR